VLKATPVITWRIRRTSPTARRSSATQLNATTNVPGTFVYTPAAGTVLNAGAAQTLSVTFTPTDTANYNPATSGAITVLKATPTITWSNAGRHRLRHGAERDAAERDDDGVPGTFVYTPAAGTVLSAGAAQTLSVTFTPTDAANYTARRRRSINVAKATPVVTWTTPATSPTAPR
jgi:hypothetical protein